MIWVQAYLLAGHGLAFSCLIAGLPVLTLVLLLGVLRVPTRVASPVALGVALLVATLGYGMPAKTAASAALNGASFGLFPILWIILWALVLFQVTLETGQFAIIKDSIGSLTPDPRLQALLIAFAFAGFLEGAAGFGTPVAIAATMLVGLGFSAFNASAVCLLANTAPVAFGSIGIPVITLALTTGLPVHSLGAAVALICTPIALLLPLYMMLAMGGPQATRGIWLPLLVAGSVFSGGQLLVSTVFGPQLTDIVSSLATLLALVLLLRFRRDSTPADPRFATCPPLFFAPGKSVPSTSLAILQGVAPGAPTPTAHVPGKLVAKAWMPYAILVATVLLWNWAPLAAVLNRATVPLAWPGLNDVVLRMPPIVNAPTPYHAIFALNFLSTPGTACMAAAVLSALVLGLKPQQFARIFLRVCRQLAVPSLTILSMLAIASVMNYCGATATLGLAFAGTSRAFPFFSPMLGWFGVFLTGSDTSANALFGNLQVVTAQRLSLAPVLMAAANSAGGVMGKMISLQTIAIAAGATGLTQTDQARLFRFTLRHSVLLVVLTGLIVLLLSNTLPAGHTV